MQKNNIVIIIPARYASTRFPAKPLALLAGKPVIQYVVEKAQSYTDNVYVATDDNRIYDAVISFGAKAIMTSTYHKSGTDRCYEAYQKILQQSSKSFDVIINIQGDEPFIHIEQIELLASCFDEDKIEIATLCKKFEDANDIFDPNKVKVISNLKGNALYFSRFAIPYCRDVKNEDWLNHTPFYKHIGMYAYRSEALEQITSLEPSRLELSESLEQLRWLENGFVIAVRTTKHESIGIDTPEDLKQAEELLK